MQIYCITTKTKQQLANAVRRKKGWLKHGPVHTVGREWVIQGMVKNERGG